MNNISSIIKYFTNYDSAGKSSDKIDSILEYQELGNYLNGSSLENNVRYEELSVNEKDELRKIYDNLKNKFANFFSNKDGKLEITEGNAEKFVNQLLVLERKNDKTENDNLLINKYKQSLFDFALKSGYDLADCEVDSIDYNFVIRETLTLIGKNNLRKANAQQSLRFVDKSYDNKNLKNAVEEYLKDNSSVALNKNGDADLGNGKFDKPTTQKTNVCWALGGINTLLQSETGKKLLENNKYYDSQTGTFAIHLQEAEDNNLHDGIYIITPQEILEESKNLAEGDGDAVAYLVAIKKYFNEVNQDTNLTEKLASTLKDTRGLDDGNYGHRFFELITGGSFSKYTYGDYSKPLEKGIGTGTTGGISFQNIYETIEKQKGAAIVVCLEHSISVVDAKDGKLIVQESNNSEDFSSEFSNKENNHTIFHRIGDINNAPAYEINEEDFNTYIQSVSFIKWE